MDYREFDIRDPCPRTTLALRAMPGRAMPEGASGQGVQGEVVDTSCDDRAAERAAERPGSSFRRRLLIESLTLLAADAAAQTAWLDAYGVATDEIALDFDHAFGMTEGLVAGAGAGAEGQLDQGVMADLREIDALLGEMSGAENADRWTRAALSADAGWSRARELARRVLVAELGEWNVALSEICVIR
ncbi:hypothetical protein ACQB60_10045 [Actinomycetota bacterium Odt1-20B]